VSNFSGRATQTVDTTRKEKDGLSEVLQFKSEKSKQAKAGI
jgi:hypothetical protein